MFKIGEAQEFRYAGNTYKVKIGPHPAISGRTDYSMFVRGIEGKYVGIMCGHDQSEDSVVAMLTAYFNSIPGFSEATCKDFLQVQREEQSNETD